MFDQCPEAVKIAEDLVKSEPKVARVMLSTMEDFAWDSKWNLILFRYCVGYLKKDPLIRLL